MESRPYQRQLAFQNLRGVQRYAPKVLNRLKRKKMPNGMCKLSVLTGLFHRESALFEFGGDELRSRHAQDCLDQ